MDGSRIYAGITRRDFARLTAAGMVGAGMAPGLVAKAPKASMYKNLGTGHLGVEADQRRAIEYAARFGFGGVNVHLNEVEKMSAGERQEILSFMREKGVKWGTSGLPVQFRTSEEEFRRGMGEFPGRAEVLRGLGVTRVTTWILPGHDSLTYRQNFELHRRRLHEAAVILKHNGIRLGLEFVGPKTSRTRSRFHFIYTQREMMELNEAIGTGNVGLLLDSWHWYTSGGTAEDLRQLSNDDVVEVHVNDAPAGIAVEEQLDMQRALPCATGVIDMRTFMNALADLRYDGPVTCEPFDKELREMDNEPALEKTARAMDCLFNLIEN
jgi:sugar phosphate isomerase/epimerase